MIYGVFTTSRFCAVYLIPVVFLCLVVFVWTTPVDIKSPVAATSIPELLALVHTGSVSTLLQFVAHSSILFFFTDQLSNTSLTKTVGCEPCSDFLVKYKAQFPQNGP